MIYCSCQILTDHKKSETVRCWRSATSGVRPNGGPKAWERTVEIRVSVAGWNSVLEHGPVEGMAGMASTKLECCGYGV